MYLTLVILKEYIGRRNRSSGTRTSILGPLGPVGPLAPGGRENRPNLNHATWHQSYSTYLAQFWWLLVTVPDLIGCILADFGYLGLGGVGVVGEVPQDVPQDVAVDHQAVADGDPRV